MIDASKISANMTREEVREVFGEPEMVGGTSRKYRTPCVYRYGKIEFHFAPWKSGKLLFVQEVGNRGHLRYLYHA
jgi:hypothetical protein